ncbi:Caffeine resistance protein 5 [Cladophialophora carrionii]|uniref:Caffeine resistance protein 5 n=1 Tax=Cladophialophora carrionii TaxID=86049 RepID=A0A1C1CN77_9EURO|nr:Caffeine resistance protein 5 [Cladophialophora carrionii]
MLDIVRDAPVGQFLRWITKNRILLYPEEKEGFVPPRLDSGAPLEGAAPDLEQSGSESEEPEKPVLERAKDDAQKMEPAEGSSTPPLMTRDDEDPLSLTISRQRSLPWTRNRLSLDQQLGLEKTKSKPISLTKSADGIILVDWYTTNDPDNPQNWSQGKKMFVLVQVCLYAFAMYGGSSIYVVSEGGVMARFGVSQAASTLGLSMYVIGYGLGPLLFAPLCEIPAIGRSGVYTPTFTLFVILCVPTAMVDNFAGLLVLRFLQGFLCSPCLANGAASIGDMFPLQLLALYLSCWTAACFWGPALGPVLAAFSVTAEGWRWSLWELLWLCAPIFAVYLIAFPETSAPNILRRRAQRLRKLTGRTDLRSQSEIDQEHMKYSAVFWDAIIKPMEIMIKDPAVAYTNIYSALLYGVYYSFFEAFPLVYVAIYGFNLGELGLTFISIGVATVIGLVIYVLYLALYLGPDIAKRGLRAPEHRLVPALFSVCSLPGGLFLFGWTSRHGVHWIVSLIGVVIVVVSNFITFQCIFVYLPMSYPQYTASLMASNALFRSLFAAGCVEFSRPMFKNLGVGPGSSLLAGLAIVGVVGMFALWMFGAKLRAKSKFAVVGGIWAENSALTTSQTPGPQSKGQESVGEEQGRLS